MKAVHKEYPEYEFVFLDSTDCDLTNQARVHEFFDAMRPDAIIHLAAISGGIGLSLRHQAGMLRDNLFMNFNVMEAARLYGVKKLIMTLTTGMYPADAPLPLKEEYIHAGDPHSSNYGSSFAKRMVEPAVRAYREEYGLSVIGLVPNGIFGMHDNFNFDDAPMLPSLIRRFYENRNNDEKLVIWGDGAPLREYTYSHDVARAFLWCLDNYDEAQILNTGTTEELSIKEIALMVAEHLNIDTARLEFDLSKPNGIYKKSVDNSRFVSLSGFEYTPFRVGLRKTIDWFVDAYENDPGSIRLYSKMHGRRESSGDVK